MSDDDGDSRMHSSPELDAEDEMFPDEAAGPSTPKHTAAFSLQDAPSDLSPPDSQGPANLARGDSVTNFSTSPSILNANGKRLHASVLTEGFAGTATTTTAPAAGTGSSTLFALSSVNQQVDPETGYTWAKNEDAPGWEWKNPRAKEDEMRAIDNIVDKGTMIKARYGDPLDSSVPAKG
ncbi:hypothetical protein P154DRAFT_124396 [Amniculicola lignicola CBS 123094]|uniref:Uncharacterized protein n=1 Tax=Amniculicola lignicola CBS 123094 TaxID=1392246 RepID=A0A6A5WMB4_9PLEO|nr:hypothetical protein P154DRAFT_124396 [Amniculicola lignicola CBS 123094]